MIEKKLIIQSTLAGIFSIITIGVLTVLTYKTSYGIFLIASFGSTMVLLYGYPESPFAQPKNIILGHFLTSLIGIIFLITLAMMAEKFGGTALPNILYLLPLLPEKI